MLNLYIRLVQKLRMCGALPPPYAFVSYSGAELLSFQWTVPNLILYNELRVSNVTKI
jgi:hypothetical protein